MNYLWENLPDKEKKFVAFFGDGSGANLFLYTGKKLIEAEGESIPINNNDDLESYLLEHGYISWLYLPDDFELFFEGEQ